MIPFNDDNKAKIFIIAERINGTCNKGLDEHIQEVFGDESLTMMDVDTLLLQELDDITQECQACGWWCDTSDLNDDQVCSDCASDE